MSDEIRDLFMSVATQSHVSKIIWNSAKAAFYLAYKNENLSFESYKEIEFQFAQSKDRDITEVAKLFRNRFVYLDSFNIERKGTILGILRTVTNDDARFLNKTEGGTHENVIRLYTIIREIDPLVQNLKYYRNHFSHTFKSNSQIGWISAVSSSVIRLCEIALSQKQDYEKNQILIKEFKNHLISIYSGKTSDTIQKEDVAQHKDAITPETLHTILKEIASSKNSILKEIQDLGLLRTDVKLETEKIFEKTELQISSRTDEVEPEEEISDEIETQISNVANLSPEGLRQELAKIGEKIKSEFSQNPGFGASGNLLQIANIGTILNYEPQTCKDFLELPIVKSRMDLNSVTIQSQLRKYENDIDVLLSSVLWLSTFED